MPRLPNIYSVNFTKRIPRIIHGSWSVENSLPILT